MKNSWLKYFIYILLIVVTVFIGNYFYQAISKNGNNPYFINIVLIIFYGGIGVILGLEQFICIKKKEGRWRINIPKLVLIGIPSLYFSLYLFIYYSNILNVISSPIGVLLRSNINFINIFQLILGYTIITSFNKFDDNEK